MKNQTSIRMLAATMGFYAAALAVPGHCASLEEAFRAAKQKPGMRAVYDHSKYQADFAAVAGELQSLGFEAVPGKSENGSWFFRIGSKGAEKASRLSLNVYFQKWSPENEMSGQGGVSLTTAVGSEHASETIFRFSHLGQLRENLPALERVTREVAGLFRPSIGIPATRRLPLTPGQTE